VSSSLSEKGVLRTSNPRKSAWIPVLQCGHFIAQMIAPAGYAVSTACRTAVGRPVRLFIYSPNPKCLSTNDSNSSVDSQVIFSPSIDLTWHMVGLTSQYFFPGSEDLR
jgi:hypothetical protein